MKVYAQRFNTYLLLAMVLALSGGCQTGGKDGNIGALSVHLQAPAIGNAETVTLLRNAPLTVRIAHDPVLTQFDVNGATVVNTPGGFAVAVQFDDDGTLNLEQYTSSNIGRHLVIYGQWGDQAGDARWLAAPGIPQRISNGMLIFTPDCSREEADKLVAGLNAAAKKNKKK